MDAAAAAGKEDDRVESSDADEEAPCKQDVLNFKVRFMSTDMEKASMEPKTVASAASSSQKEQDHREQQIERARAEMSQVREENQRLKMCLDQIMKDYEALKRRCHEIIQRDQGKKSSPLTYGHEEVEEVDDMVSLTLGRFSRQPNRRKENDPNEQKTAKQDLGSVGVANETPQNDDQIRSPQEDPKEEEGGETWPPGKSLKNLRSGEDEGCQQSAPKKTRVCVRARCDTPTMNDGCQWRKYGQKIAKGNPCPRAYYRCTGSPTCPVRKQVQRSVDDISILITTYEGTHNHPLPVSAMAMASTTSAAASMLLAGSSASTSRPAPGPHDPPSITTVNSSSALHATNLYLANNSNSKSFYLPNSSVLSSSLTHPTITLDLTSNPPSTSSSSPFHKLNSSYPPKYPFTSLDFGSSPSNFMSWTNGNYANQPYSKNTIGTAMDIARQLPLQNNMYQTYLQKMNNPSIPPPQPPPIPDTIAAATKAITSDPSFQSALVAALSSIIGGSSGNGNGSSFVSKTPNETSSQQESLPFLPPSTISCTTTKSPSSSPADSRDHHTK